jgi:heat shock protein HslJ
MKGVIGFLFFLLFMAGLFLVFLQGKTMTGAGLSAGGAELTAVRWQATFIGPEPVPEDAGIWVLFEVDGSIGGNAGCNSFSGSLEKTESGIKVGPLAATRMACPEPAMSRETAFLGALQQASAFEVAAQRMACLDSAGNLLVEFTAPD